MPDSDLVRRIDALDRKIELLLSLARSGRGRKPRYLTVAEAAERLNAAEATVRQWLREGLLAGTKRGRVGPERSRAWAIAEGEIDRFLNRDPAPETRDAPCDG